jgi:hypothetical protein
VPGVLYGPGLLAPTWLPAGFGPAPVTRSGTGMPTENYVLAGDAIDPPRIELGFADYRLPIGRLIGAGPGGGVASGRARDHRPDLVPALIEGRPGRLERPGHHVIVVYWKPDGTHLLTVAGYSEPASVVLTVARNVWFDPPGLVSLPLSPGRVISRSAAARTARRVSGLRLARAVAKLSSWAELVAMLTAGRSGADVSKVPGVFNSGRWQAVWAVLLIHRSGGTATLVVLDAATGQPVVTAPTGPHPSWFAALTDRSSTIARRCQGGSRARLPFGVLTRNEESYVTRAQAGLRVDHATTSESLTLTTVSALNRADSAIYGDCVQQGCSIAELVWVAITTVRADPGTTVACLPRSAGAPSRYRPAQVRQYYGVVVPGNTAIYCRKLPSAIARLKDLAPPVAR